MPVQCLINGCSSREIANTAHRNSMAWLSNTCKYPQVPNFFFGLEIKIMHTRPKVFLHGWSFWIDWTPEPCCVEETLASSLIPIVWCAITWLRKIYHAHLFFTCPFPTACWQQLGLHWTNTNCIHQRLARAKQTMHPAAFLHGDLYDSNIIWELWKLRNGKNIWRTKSFFQPLDCAVQRSSYPTTS